jgi:hypothetical protein
MLPSTWTVTLRGIDEPLGVSIYAPNGTITRFAEGAFAKLNESEPGSVELGDRIVEVEGKGGRMHDLFAPWLRDGKLTGSLRVTLLRPILVQPVVLLVEPGKKLGIGISDQNVIHSIDKGLVSELNRVSPGSIEVKDRILEVEGKAGNAAEQVRSWVQDNKDTSGDLHLKVARQAKRTAFMPTPAWSFSVMIRVRPGETLGAIIKDNFIKKIKGGAIAKLNKAHPQSVQVGDRIHKVDEIRLPGLNSSDELDSWLQGRTDLKQEWVCSKDLTQELRLTLLRPVELAEECSVLPPCEHCFVDVLMQPCDDCLLELDIPEPGILDIGTVPHCSPQGADCVDIGKGPRSASKSKSRMWALGMSWPSSSGSVPSIPGDGQSVGSHSNDAASTTQTSLSRYWRPGPRSASESKRRTWKESFLSWSSSGSVPSVPADGRSAGNQAQDARGPYRHLRSEPSRSDDGGSFRLDIPSNSSISTTDFVVSPPGGSPPAIAGDRAWHTGRRDHGPGQQVSREARFRGLQALSELDLRDQIRAASALQS